MSLSTQTHFLSLPLWLWILFALITVILISLHITCCILQKLKPQTMQVEWWDDQRPLPAVPEQQEGGEFRVVTLEHPSSPPIRIPTRSPSIKSLHSGSEPNPQLKQYSIYNRL